MLLWGLSSPASPKAAGAGHAVAVAIASFSYQPADVRIQAGDTVEWRNLDPTVHTVTASRGEFSSGSMRQGQTFRATFNAPGVYPYFCEPHETMRGSVSVTGPAAPTTTVASSVPSTTTVATTTTFRATQPLLPPSSVPNHNGSTARNPPTPVVAPVVASAVTGDIDQPSPVLPIGAVLAVTAGVLIAAHLAALGALAITRTDIGLFGFHEIGWDPSPQLPVAVTLGLVAIGLLSAARPTR